jgi:hypothetical protein
MVVTPSEIRENHLLKDEIKELCDEISKLNGEMSVKEQIIDEYEFRIESQDQLIATKDSLIKDMERKFLMLQGKLRELEEERNDRVNSQIILPHKSPSDSHLRKSNSI